MKIEKAKKAERFGLAQYVVRDTFGKQLFPKQAGKTATFMECQQYVERQKPVTTEAEE